mmetsp:Transcript_4298/g.6498  ORF Transcript_4298/g.6498 Transcript_4298/m.6498 type:complete len:295 (-) Transcript_4298:474-1358(-)
MESYILSTFLIILLCYLISRKRPKVVSEVIHYPIKSCAGINLSRGEVSDLGLKNDREWAITDQNQNIITLREDPRLYRLQPKLESHHLVLTYPGFPNFKVPLNTNPTQEFQVEFGKASGQAVDAGASSWLSRVFGKPYKLVRITQHRQMNQVKNQAPGISDNFKLNFPDKSQVLVVSQESYQELSKHLPGSVPFSNFRPNIVVKNCQPFEEDHWKTFEINGVVFEGVELCCRCLTTTVNPSSLTLNREEPLKTLRKLHGKGAKAYFGLLAVRKNNGSISVQDTVKVLSKEPRSI